MKVPLRYAAIFRHDCLTICCGNYPADLVPYGNYDDTSRLRANGKRLSMEMLDVEITSETGDTARVITKTDELVFNVLARADFDHDGSEDLFIRVDWRTLNAFGQGSGVFVIAKPDDASPIEVIGRRSE